jgi:hypothetical protein
MTETAALETATDKTGGSQPKEMKKVIVIILFDTKYLFLMRHKHGENEKKELTLINGKKETNASLEDLAKALLTKKTGVSKYSLPVMKYLGQFNHEDERSEVEASVFICTQYFRADVLESVQVNYKRVFNALEKGEIFTSVNGEELTCLTEAILKNYKNEIEMLFTKASTKGTS